MLTYRILISLAAPFLAAIALWRILRGRATFGDLRQLLGGGPGQPGALWIHGASNGELASARALIGALRKTFPNLPLLITCNTVTARAMVQDWQMPGVTVRLAPIDLRWVQVRLRTQWQPVALISLENEIWPNRFVTSTAPVIVVAARMSKQSAQQWGKFAPLAHLVLSHIARLYPQDGASGTRFCALGLPSDRLGPVAQLKSGVSQTPPDPDTLIQIQSIFTRAQTILAASTHDGDEALILRAFSAARATNPDLRLIIAPRHPRRSAEVRALIAATGLPYAVRTEMVLPEATCAIYLADTLGEMPLWYASAGITVIGGTFTDRGGHTPFEPTQFGSALIHGPDVANFAESYAALRDQDAAINVADQDAMIKALCDLNDPDVQREMAKRARQTLDGLDDSAAIIDEITADLSRRIN